MTTLMADLKAATRPHHERIEKVIAPMRPGLTRPEYRQLLEKFLGFYRPWEARVAELLGGTVLGEFFAPRRKSHLLEADLAALGLTPAEIAALPDCELLPDLFSLPRALGSMYVIEGSTLGGQYITRHLKKSLALTPDECRFYNAYGPETGAMWGQFQGVMARFANRKPIRSWSRPPPTRSTVSASGWAGEEKQEESAD